MSEGDDNHKSPIAAPNEDEPVRPPDDQEKPVELSAGPEESAVKPKGRRRKSRYASFDEVEKASQALSTAIKEAIAADAQAVIENRLGILISAFETAPPSSD